MSSPASHARRVRHHQSDSRRRTRQRNGALLRSRHRSHHLRRAGRERHRRSRRGQRGRRRNRFPSARGHHHGPRRSRQDHAARLHSLDQRCGRRSRRHHPAHRRLQGSHRRPNPPAFGREIVFLDTPGHEAFTAHALPRRQSHRHRRARRRRRRRRHAADGRGHRPRSCRRSAHHRRRQQNR